MNTNNKLRLNKNKLSLQIVGLNSLNTKHKIVWRQVYNVREVSVCTFELKSAVSIVDEQNYSKIVVYSII